LGVDVGVSLTAAGGADLPGTGWEAVFGLEAFFQKPSVVKAIDYNVIQNSRLRGHQGEGAFLG
jgi:hypothetical protein